jgi:hypothetical protein
MADDSSGIIDKVSKAVALVSLCIAVYAAWKALPADAEIKRLQTETVRLDLALKQADADLKNIESSRKMTMELYQEVKNVIRSKETTGREEDAVRVLVESLADDPLRYKLLNVIATGAKSSEVKAAATETSKFFKDESQAVAQVAPATNSANPSRFGAFNVDFFYCENKKATSESIARAAMGLKSASDTGRWRLRSLPESINQQPGYQIDSNVVRFNPPDERDVAEAIAQGLKTLSVPVRFEETSYSTPGYVSVFICQ